MTRVGWSVGAAVGWVVAMQPMWAAASSCDDPDIEYDDEVALDRIEPASAELARSPGAFTFTASLDERTPEALLDMLDVSVVGSDDRQFTGTLDGFAIDEERMLVTFVSDEPIVHVFIDVRVGHPDRTEPYFFEMEVIQDDVDGDLAYPLFDDGARVEQRAQGQRVCCSEVIACASDCTLSASAGAVVIGAGVDLGAAYRRAGTYAELFGAVDGVETVVMRGLVGDMLSGGRISVALTDSGAEHCLHLDTVEIGSGTRHRASVCRALPGADALETTPRDLATFVDSCPGDVLWDEDDSVFDGLGAGGTPPAESSCAVVPVPARDRQHWAGWLALVIVAIRARRHAGRSMPRQLSTP